MTPELPASWQFLIVLANAAGSMRCGCAKRAVTPRSFDARLISRTKTSLENPAPPAMITSTVKSVVVVGMIQLMGSPYPLRADLKVATYQALTEILE